MSIFYAFLLGLIQGATEFLPVSSSGHLVLAQSILPGFTTPGLVFDVVLHAGTLAAVLLYYRNDLLWLAKGSAGLLSIRDNREARRWVTGLCLATVPAAIAGILVNDFIESLFESPRMTAVFLCGTGLILFAGEWLKQRNRHRDPHSRHITWMQYGTVGLAQALAILPGISRSGSTMAAGLAVGWSRDTAARFSFLLMIPAVSGAVLLKALEIPDHLASGSIAVPEISIGFLTAAIVGYCAIALLLKLIRKHTFKGFAGYCLGIGILTLGIQYFLN